MEELHLRLQDNRKVTHAVFIHDASYSENARQAFSAQFRRMVEQENALMDERRRHETCQQTLIKTKLSEKQVLLISVLWFSLERLAALDLVQHTVADDQNYLPVSNRH